jgi:hypothetical protein
MEVTFNQQLVTKVSSFGSDSEHSSQVGSQHLDSELTSTVDRALQTTAGRFEWLTLVFRDMTDKEGCQHNCSGHGTCDNGICVCMVRIHVT